MKEVELENIISLSVLIAFVVPLVLFVITRDLRFLFIFIGEVVCVALTKLWHGWVFAGIDTWWAKRPKGACDCDAFNQGGLQEDDAGFPSGHMTCTVFFWVALAIIFKKHWKLFIVIGIIHTVLMAYARIYKKCHNVIQVSVGIAQGGLLGTLLTSMLGLITRSGGPK